MAKKRKSETVPKGMQAKFDAITALTDQFAQDHLNTEYAELMRLATAALCRKRPSPLEKGRDKTWACGVAHAVGMVNFLYDSSQTPHITASALYKYFGVGNSTGQGKSKLIRDTLKMRQLDPEWCLPSRIDDNPMIWMLSVNGFIMDIRSAPLGAQVEAFLQGLIPYIPGHKEDSEAIAAQLKEINGPIHQQRETRQQSSRKTGQKLNKKQIAEASKLLYVLKISIFDGPLTEAFVKKNPEMSRVIEIQGGQTLKELHGAIFAAFDREEEHMYEFQVGGTGPNDPNADRYVLAVAMDDDFGTKPAGDVAKTAIAALDLEIDESFGYWFDFGDDWWHQVSVEAIEEPAAKVKYPRVTERVGASPPQYAEF